MSIISTTYPYSPILLYTVTVAPTPVSDVRHYIVRSPSEALTMRRCEYSGVCASRVALIALTNLNSPLYPLYGPY